MRTCILAAITAAFLSVPAYSQTTVAQQPVMATASPTAVTEEQRIPVDERAPQGSSNPVVGSGVAMIVVAIGILILSSVAFMGPSN